MVVTFWGVRGSTPVPGPHTVRYGGNTSCVSVDLHDHLLIFDAGTGIRALGDHLEAGDRRVTLFLTHLHTDHIGGFPFFAPLYVPGRELTLVAYPLADDRYWSPFSLMDGTHFPVRSEELPSNCRVVQAPPEQAAADLDLKLSAYRANHPGGAFGYRLSHGGRTFAYLPDNELDVTADTVVPEPLVEFCRGVDVLCHDAQYVRSEWNEFQGWGHSTVDATCRLAEQAEVGHLVLFHHDPARTDAELDAIQRRARSRLNAAGIQCTVAAEGLELTL